MAISTAWLATLCGILVFFVVLVGCVYGDVPGRRRRRQRGKDAFDAVGLIEGVEDSTDLRAKYSVVSRVEAATNARLERLRRSHGDGVRELAREETAVRDLELQLQQIQRSLALGEDEATLRRMVDHRGAEMFGAEWNAPARGIGPSLGELVRSGAKLDDSEDEAEHFSARRTASVVHPSTSIPKLALSKVRGY